MAAPIAVHGALHRGAGARYKGFTLAEALHAVTRANPQLAALQAQGRAAEADVGAAGLWSSLQLKVLGLPRPQ